jgi:hypothetical protein
MVGDLEEEDGDSVLEEALPPGLMLAWEEEDCPGVGISSAELREQLLRRAMPLMVALGLRLIMEEWLIRELCHMAVMLGHL